MRIVAGAPVCDRIRLQDVVEEWERSEESAVCYFGAEARLVRALEGSAVHASVVLGAQPIWSPTSFLHAIEDHASLRAQLHRAENKGVSVEEWPAERASKSEELRHVLAEWLETRGLPPLHFLVEPDTLASLGDRRIFVCSLRGVPVGFVVLSPVPTRRGWLTEQFVRGFEAPNGAVELALYAAVKSVSAEGAELVTMGIVPLSPHAGSHSRQNPGWLRGVSSWARAHGRRFYNFDGLDDFKSKFSPDRWEPIYAISTETSFSPKTLYAIAHAFTRGNPFWSLARGVGRAAAQEVRWLGGRRRG